MTTPPLHTPGTPNCDDPLAALLSRHSLGPRWMVPPGPSPEQLTLALQAALRAPNHGRLQPWRVVSIADTQRPALADLFEHFARDSGKSEEDVAIERERAFNGPVLLAWVARIDDTLAKVPPHEQWICVGGAFTNFMNAVHIMGYGAKILSGRKCQHPAIVQAFCEDGEQLVGFICVGTATRELEPREKDEPMPLISAWQTN